MTQSFTVVELEIAELAGRGFGYWRIATLSRRKPRGVRQIINTIALKLDNPDDLPPLTLVQLWGAHRIWLRSQQVAA